MKADKRVCKQLKLERKQSKITYYKNPKEFNRLYLERVNPDHKGIIWGQKPKTNRFIKIGRVIFTEIAIVFKTGLDGIQSIITTTIHNILSDMSLAICCYYIVFALFFVAILLNIPVIEGVMCLRVKSL